MEFSCMHPTPFPLAGTRLPSRTKARFSLTERQTLANRLLSGPQKYTLLRGGSRSGKTFLLVRAIVLRALRGPGSRHAILRFRGNAARASIWLDTLPKVMRLCFPGVPWKLFANQSQSFLRDSRRFFAGPAAAASTSFRIEAATRSAVGWLHHAVLGNRSLRRRAENPRL